MKMLRVLPCLVTISMFMPALGQEGLKVDTILSDLDNPAGIAIQPETGVVFVSDSGAKRIVKVTDGKVEPVITDFAVDEYGKGPKYNIGPLGLLFLDKNTLVVGGGDLKDGEDALRVYDLKDMKEALKADKFVDQKTLPAVDELKPEGNFYALAGNADGIYVTCNGDDTKGWVSKATFKDGKLEFSRYLATKEAVELDAPVGITMSPRGELVIGQMGEITVPNDSMLTFYDANSKEKLLNVKTNLHDITSLAYSARGNLYALDFAWSDTKQGGLFQLLDDGANGVKTKKILELDKPTAMVFDAEGALYITTIGEEKKGKLLKVAPGL